MAPIWRRFVAASIDTVLVLGGIGVAASLVATLSARNRRFGDLLDRGLAWARQRSERRPVAGGHLARAQRGARIVHEVQRRNHQSYGQKLMRIRRVDASDGGPVTVRSALVRYAVSQLVSASGLRAAKLDAKRVRARVEARIGVSAVPADTNHPADDAPEAVAEELPAGAISFMLTPSMVIPPALILALQCGCMFVSPRRQTVSQLAAGIVTTTERVRTSG